MLVEMGFAQRSGLQKAVTEGGRQPPCLLQLCAWEPWCLRGRVLRELGSQVVRVWLRQQQREGLVSGTLIPRCRPHGKRPRLSESEQQGPRLSGPASLDTLPRRRALPTLLAAHSVCLSQRGSIRCCSTGFLEIFLFFINLTSQHSISIFHRKTSL